MDVPNGAAPFDKPVGMLLTLWKETIFDSGRRMATKFDSRQLSEMRTYWSRRLAEEEARAARARSAADREAYLKACAHLNDLLASHR